ncbi:hypothetical protein [Streptomyces sp. NRRL S-87]|uniref:hypothetical protein n=1 Tax=Streptomyces sp. NRRL S-87 TaxID=1463920 RepID=UPI0004BF3692|nr:hypothetical protein [Streptomyces sp. NRRL S-87]
MHSYDASRPQSYQSHIPSMRPPRERDFPGGSHTPIYDALCSEYQRAFRALPGDRTGEEDLGFAGFGALTSSGLAGSAWDPWQSWNAWGTDRSGADARGSDSWQQVPSYAGQGGGPYPAGSAGYGAARPHQAATHVPAALPAALPPAPRRGA